MVGVARSVFVGNLNDAEYGWKRNEEWAFIYCAKEPWHRRLVGYAGRGCPKDSPEYLYAIRDNAIALNMVDVENPEYFAKEMLDMAVGFAWNFNNRKLLFSCTQGESCSPSVAMLYLAVVESIPNGTFEEAEKDFKKRYPYYNPRNGIREHLKRNWGAYTK